MNAPADRFQHTLLCIAVGLAWFMLPMVVSMLPGYMRIYRAGFATPLLYFMFWLPFALFCWQRYQKRFGLLPVGGLRVQSLVLPGLALLALSIIHGLFGRQEPWSATLSQMSSLNLALTAVCICLLAPVVEEVICRGFLLNAGIGWGKTGQTIAMVGTSLFFAIGHAQYQMPTTFVWLFVFSIILCQVRIHTGSLLAPIVLHSATNIIGMMAALKLS
ncbi:CPBP family intramembrane glutamic endopeptidase [Cronobacter turicensis]|nr:CPBP family intramembrane metalloprotease [Cronobacter turicensis]